MKLRSTFAGTAATIAAIAFLAVPANAGAATSGAPVSAKASSVELAALPAWVRVKSFYYSTSNERVTSASLCYAAAVGYNLDGIYTQCVDQGSRWDLLIQV